MMEVASVAASRAAAESQLRILACASQGSSGDDEERLRTLLSRFDTTFHSFSRQDKWGSFRRCMAAFGSGDYDMLVLEGTGVGAGIPAILTAVLFGIPYVLSSGDAVGPFLAARFPLGTPLFHMYERLLYACCSGFIGWTPYLVGRAITLGAERAITCPGWAPYKLDPDVLLGARQRIRCELGIPADSVVFGIAGALTWSSRYEYCYGLELVHALRHSSSNARVLIVGDGDGITHLKQAAGDLLGSQIFFTGRIRRGQVPEYLAAMDIGSLPQSVNGVGNFRYTTKISEYRSVGLPFLTNETPAGYDLDRGDIWRLPGTAPWDAEFLHALTIFMETISLADLGSRTESHGHDMTFDRDTQICRTTAFLQDIIQAREQRLRSSQGNAGGS